MAQRLEAGERQAHQLVHQQIVKLARVDMAVFFRYVMRHMQTGQRVEPQAFQVEWCSLAEQFDRLMILAYMGSGKSMWLTVALTLWELGRDPSLQFLLVSRNSELAEKLGRMVALYIEQSPELHEVFPWLRPDPRMPWNSHQISVVRPGISKDPSVQFVGIGKSFQGSRLDRVVLDDVLDWSNTRTQGERDKMWDWHQTSIPGRLSETGRERAVGNVFHKQDLYHRLARNERWRAYRFPIFKRDGSSSWPKQWPGPRIEARRQELGDILFKIQMMCEPVDIGVIGMMFRRSEAAYVDAFPAGLGPFCRRWDLACTEPHDGNWDPDWTVGTKMCRTADKKYFIAHVERARTRDPLGLIKRTANADGRGVEIGIPQDPGQAGKDQVQTYSRELAGFRMWSESETGDKVTRAMSWSTQWQHGNAILLRAQWNEPFLANLEAFPTPNVHDDDVDSSGGAFRHLTAGVVAYTGNTGTGWHPRR
jgi:predicted phage terminase large subunit-like protein